jgi:cyclophilin family peptidyl-prolyl cis-trans isomerase
MLVSAMLVLERPHGAPHALVTALSAGQASALNRGQPGRRDRSARSGRYPRLLVGSPKRERQKANRLQRQIDEARAERASAVKRNALRWTIVAIAAIGGVVLIAWLGGAFDNDDEGLQTTDEPPVVDDTPTITVAADDPAFGDDDSDDADPASDDGDDVDLAADAASDTPPTVPEMADPSECPATDGSESQQREFDEYPPFCIDVTKTYTAEIVTNFGEMTFEFDAERAPLTVNSFVTLARYKYFDGTECHRAIPGFVVQCGDPTATGTGGPGYDFSDELPEAGEYQIGSLAMANSGPDTNGSQFFIITGDQGVALPPQYSLFGDVIGGLDTTVADLDAVANPESNGVPPLEQIIIESVTISEA